MDVLSDLSALKVNCFSKINLWDFDKMAEFANVLRNAFPSLIMRGNDLLFQTVWLSHHTRGLFFLGLCPQIKPLLPETAGSELQSPRRLRGQRAHRQTE